MLREVHKPRQIHNLLSHHTHTLPDRHNRDSHHLGKPGSETHPHTQLTPPDMLGRVPEVDTQSGDILRQIGSTHVCRHTHKPTQTHYTQALTSTEITDPPIPGRHRHKLTAQLPPLPLPQREQQTPCTAPEAHRHTPETHPDTWPRTHKGHGHRALRCHACSIC